MSIDANTLAVIKHRCEREHDFFIRYFFKKRFETLGLLNWAHVWRCEEIDRLIERAEQGAETENLVFNLPPGGSKTEIMMNTIAHGLAINHRSRFLYLSYSSELVADVSDNAKSIVKSSDYQQLWKTDLSKSTDNKKEWKVRDGDYDAGHVFVASMGGQVTGRRGGRLEDGFTGLICIDDPIKPEDVFSEKLRKKANRKIINTVQSRKAKSDTPVVMIMQRLHVNDPVKLTQDGSLTGKWRHIVVPALIDDDYIASLPPHIAKLVPRDAPRDDKGRQSYWHAKESLASLLQMEQGGGEDADGQAISRYTFNAQYMQAPTALGGDLIRSDWFGRYDQLPPLQWLGIYVDTAQKTAEHNDYTVFLVGGVDVNGYFYLVDIVRGKWQSPQMIAKGECVIERYHKPKPPLRYMAVEDKSSGTTLIQTISKTAKVPIKAVQRGTDKLTRFMDVQSIIEAGRVFIPRYAPWVQEFLTECEAFTADFSHDHDDQIDALMDFLALGSQPATTGRATAGNRTY